MKTLQKLILAVLINIVPFTLLAQDIIGAKDANTKNKKGEIILISARPATDFAKVHAMGAINVDPAELVNELQMLKPVGDISTLLGNKGINSSKNIVVYDDGAMKGAGRIYWTLKYLGVENVTVVDGGMKSWRINRLPVTKNPTMAKKTTFSPKIQKQYLADFVAVKSSINQPSTILLDVRSADEFNDPAGHLPGSINLEYSNVLNTNGTLKSVAQLTELFEKQGITKDKKVIVFCRSSVRAGVVFLALHSALDYPNVKVYDGAFLEWQQKAPNRLGTD